jgi:hypothetical protein
MLPLIFGFCGFYVAGSGQQLTNDATQVVLMREGTRTVMSMQNDYKGPPEAFAMVVPVPVVLHEGDVKTLPLRFFYDSDTFELPIRLGLANSAGTQDLIVNILAPNQRYQVANYPNVMIPTNLEVRPSVKDHFGEFYAALFDQTLEKHPGAVVRVVIPLGCYLRCWLSDRCGAVNVDRRADAADDLRVLWVFNDATEVVLMRDGTRTVMSMQRTSRP